MGIDIFRSKYGGEVFVCNTSDTAFGPVMDGDAKEFLEWITEDPRKYGEKELIQLYRNDFRAQKDTTRELLYKIDDLFQDYANEDVDGNYLRNKINKLIDNYCDG